MFTQFTTNATQLKSLLPTTTIVIIYSKLNWKCANN